MTISTSITAECIVSVIFCWQVPNGLSFLMAIRKRLLTLWWIWRGYLFYSNWIQKYAVLGLFQSLFLFFWLVWLGLNTALLVKLFILLIKLFYILFTEDRAFSTRCNFLLLWASKLLVRIFLATIFANFIFTTFALRLFVARHI